jgi:hypothetical protein
MPFPEDVDAECQYRREAWFIHDVLELNAEEGRVVGWIDSTRLGPIVDAQVVRPGHPKHFPGAVMVQVTGTLGQLHATYLLGLRPSEGWSGFGTSIKHARFPNPGVIGPPVIATAVCAKARQYRGTWHLTYDIVFEQAGRHIYESRQTAAWFQMERPL